MSKNKKKGDQLEDVVAKIEEWILTQNNLNHTNKISIEKNKVLIKNGERIEVDVWVEIDNGPGYKSVVIFECKNWTKKVGPSEIAWFEHKINLTEANLGYFVAKEFTKYAVQTAANKSRLELLTAKEHNTIGLAPPFGMHFIHVIPKHPGIKISFDFVGKKLKNEDLKELDFDIRNSRWRLGREPIDQERFLTDWHNELINERLNSFDSSSVSDGIYELKHTGRKNFEDEKLKVEKKLHINEREIRYIDISFNFFVKKIATPPTSIFEILERGRVDSLKPVTIGGVGKFQINLISTKPPHPD